MIALLLDQKLKEGGQSFIVCPASLIYNWESEFQNFAPEICAKVIAGTQEGAGGGAKGMAGTIRRMF